METTRATMISMNMARSRRDSRSPSHRARPISMRFTATSRGDRKAVSARSCTVNPAIALSASARDAFARNPILVTALNPVIGYEKGAAIAKRAYAEGRPVFDVAREMTSLTSEELTRLMDPRVLTRGGIGKKQS